MVVKAWWQEFGVSGPTVSAVREQREKDAGVHPGYSSARFGA